MTPTVCAICDGTSWVESPTPDPRLATAKYPGRPPMARCACFWARAHEQRLAAAGIPAKYQACTFANYHAYNNTLRDALVVADAYAARDPRTPPPVERAPGLILIGPAGVGKSHLAAALLMEVIRHSRAYGLFYKTLDLLRLLRESYNPATQTTPAEILQPILTCDLLVLDDLGVERVTEWVAETLNHIVDTRYSTNRPLVCTTNFGDTDDPEEVNGLLWRVGFRMQSRLHEMCEFLTLDGADYRDLPPDQRDAADLVRLWKARRKPSATRDLRRGPRPTPKDGKADLRWPGGRGGNN